MELVLPQIPKVLPNDFCIEITDYGLMTYRDSEKLYEGMLHLCRNLYAMGYEVREWRDEAEMKTKFRFVKP